MATTKSATRQSRELSFSLALVLLSLAFLIPAHYPPWSSFQSQWLAALGVTVLLFHSTSHPHRDPLGRSTYWLLLAALASACIPPIQFAAGMLQFRSDAIVPSLYWAGAAMAIVVSAHLASLDRQRWLDGLFGSLMVAAIASAGIAVMQWLDLSARSLWLASVPPGSRPFANLGQPNHLATLLLLGIVGLIRGYEQRRLGHATFALSASWLCFALASTQSRSGLLGLVLLALWWMHAGRRFDARLRAKVIVPAMAALGLLVYFWEPMSRQLLLGTAQPLGDRLAAGPRLAIWSQAFDASLKQPWFGYGWNQAAYAQLTVAAEHPALGRQWDSAHNLILDLALAAGWPVALFWTGLMSTWLWLRFRRARTADDWAILGGITVILTHALLEYPLEYVYFLAPLALLIGSSTESARSTRFLPGAVSKGMVALLIGSLTWIGIEYLQVEQAHRDIRMSLMNFEGSSPIRPVTADTVLLDAPVALQWLMLSRASAGMTAPELERMRQAAHRYPMPPALMRLALAQGLNGQPAEAQLTLRRLCAVHPPTRCNEGRDSWLALQQQYPVLRAVPAPEVPAAR
jgi:O-antigen ligase